MFIVVYAYHGDFFQQIVQFGLMGIFQKRIKI
jgi:hypothetical protein